MDIKYKATIMDGAAMDRALVRIAHQILEHNADNDSELCLVGIKTRGVPLAMQLAENIYRISGSRPAIGELDITAFRDDIDKSEISRHVALPFDVSGKTVVLCDDVIYTGRSARAAMEAVIYVGRPKSIQLFALIDRGHRELPIRPDFVGKNVPTARSEEISVCLPQTDGEHCVKLGSII